MLVMDIAMISITKLPVNGMAVIAAKTLILNLKKIGTNIVQIALIV